MGQQMSAESFNPRDESAIRGQDVLMKHRQQAQNEEKHINKKYLQGSESGTWAELSADAESNSAPTRPRRDTHPVRAAVLRLCWKKQIKKNLELWPATHHRAQHNTQYFHILKLSC